MPTFRNAREFLEAVVRRYRELSSYSDTGRSHCPNCRRERLCTFRTDFVAPNNFRFAFESPHPYRRLKHLKSQVVVGTHLGKQYFYDKTYSDTPSIEIPESLELAIAGATGISSGTAHTIGALLFPEVGGFTMLDLRCLRFRRDRVVDGIQCVAVSGLHPRGGRYTAWFGTHDLLLRRIVRAKFRAEELRREIRVGHALADDLFLPPPIET